MFCYANLTKILVTCLLSRHELSKTKKTSERYLTFQMVCIINKVLTSIYISLSGQPYLIFGLCCAIIVVYDFKNLIPVFAKND